MARTFGKLLSSVWLDPDWLTLTRDEQWLYQALLSQPGLSLVGALDYRPRRLAMLNEATTATDIEVFVAGLEDRNYVAVDYDTEELLIRTFTRHDGIAAANKNLRKGMWKAWTEVASPRLRHVAVVNMPPELFAEDEDVPAPDAAVLLRRSPLQERASEPSFGPPFDRSFQQATESLGPNTGHLTPDAESDCRSDRISEAAQALAGPGLLEARSALSRRCESNHGPQEVHP